MNVSFRSQYLNKHVKLSDVYKQEDLQYLSSDTSDDELNVDQTHTLFIIDKKANNDEIVSNPLTRNSSAKPNASQLSSSLKADNTLNGYFSGNKSAKQTLDKLNELSLKTMNEELSAKTCIKAGFEQQFCVKPFRQSKRMKKKMNAELRSQTTGPKWFDVKQVELTDERKNDLMALSMRKALHPKRFYKKNDSKEIPKYFQVGTVVESAADFYHSRVPKKQRKRTFVEELLEDAEVAKYAKKRYKQALAQNPYYLRMKRRKERQKLGESGLNRNNKKKFNRKKRNQDIQ